MSKKKVLISSKKLLCKQKKEPQVKLEALCGERGEPV